MKGNRSEQDSARVFITQRFAIILYIASALLLLSLLLHRIPVTRFSFILFLQIRIDDKQHHDIPPYTPTNQCSLQLQSTLQFPLNNGRRAYVYLLDIVLACSEASYHSQVAGE